MQGHDDELPNALIQRVALVLWHRGQHLILVRKRRDDGYGRWETPSSRVADGETLTQAAARVALLVLGLSWNPSRFSGGVFREQRRGDEHVMSLKADLTDAEFESITVNDPTGRFKVAKVSRFQIKEYLPSKRDRQLMS